MAFMGVGVPWQLGDSRAALSALGGLPNYNWWYNRIGERGYTPMLWACKPGGNFENAVAASNRYPDVFWLLGNEPRPPSQSNTTPAVFAESVREWQRRTACSFAVAGELIYTQADNDWLDAYVAIGGPVGEYWHVHNYNRNPEEWEQAHRRFVRWMERRNVVRPVIVSETAAAGHAVPAQHALLEWLPTAMRDMPYLHSIYWYSVRHFTTASNWHNSNLTNPDGSLTELGDTFVSVQAAGTRAAAYRLYLPRVERD